MMLIATNLSLPRCLALYMCGIFGSFTTEPLSQVAQQIQSAQNSLAHRGPNDRGSATYLLPSGTLALGHTRLSIIDLSDAGHQPMVTQDGLFTIVFNGEIYNYIELRDELRRQGAVFKTNTDTEVLLACWQAWGPSCLSKLKGMFAFAIFDHANNRLTCVRDAFGIKPLFWSQHDRRFAFASELPTIHILLNTSKKLNLQCAYDYLIHGKYDHSSETFLEGIYQLPPGHRFTVDLLSSEGSNGSASMQKPEIQRWWWPKVDERTDLSLKNAAEQFRCLFLDSVRLHLRSDVPLGVALSGGVDSSSLVCALRHVEPDMPIHTFSFIVPGSPLNEEVWIDQINASTPAISHKIVIEPNEILSDIDNVILAQGEPFGGTSIYAQYRVFKCARDYGITVTLEGQGGDELLAGYCGYPAERLHSLVERGRLLQAAKFCYHWSRWPGRSVTRAVGGLAAQVSPSRIQNYLNSFRGSQTTDWIDPHTLHEQGVALDSPFSRLSVGSQSGRRLASALRRDLSGALLAHLLRHADRNSMRWSLESRVPLLNTDLAEFTLSLPENYLVSPKGETKHLIRVAMRGLIPDRIIDRRDKVGFAPPDQFWIRGLLSLAPQWLEAANNFSFLRYKELLRFVDFGCHTTKRFDFGVWRILNFCRWTQLNGVEQP